MVECQKPVLNIQRSIKDKILHILLNEHLRLTPISLERIILNTIPGATRREVRAAVKELIMVGELSFTQHFSTTHIELNYNRPFQVSPRIIISPKEYNDVPDDKHMVIKLNDGSSFGAGDHPTTRMMLRGLDELLSDHGGKNMMKINQVLDIGTGSGVLALAAAVLGVGHVEGVDIDPLACHEAKTNVSLNGLNGRVKISQATLKDFSPGCFDLLLANLRPPTIRQLIPLMLQVSSPNAVWIISGCRANEKKRIIKNLPSDEKKIIWQEDQNNWSAFTVKWNSDRNKAK